MRPEQLVNYLVPLALLALWALTALFNRESQPLPPRTGRPPGPNGPRPSPQPAPRANDWRPEPSPRPAPSPPRPAPTLSSRPTARAGDRIDDGIVILESEPRRNEAAPSRGSGSATPRRAAKATRAPQPAPASRRGETVTPRALTQIRCRASRLTRRVCLPTLAGRSSCPTGDSPLLTSYTDQAAKTQADRASTDDRYAFSAADLRTRLQDQIHLREIFVFNELMSPPLSLRKGQTARPRPGPRG